MERSCNPDEDERRDLDDLGRVYGEASSRPSARAHDGLYIQITTNLDIILSLLGWRPERAHALMPPGPAAGT
jgi:hypothetical protein